jgi:hypothetical protein
MTGMERKHLAEADRHIAKCKAQVARQQKIIRQICWVPWRRVFALLKDTVSVSFLGPMPARSRRYRAPPRRRSSTDVPMFRLSSGSSYPPSAY